MTTPTPLTWIPATAIADELIAAAIRDYLTANTDNILTTYDHDCAREALDLMGNTADAYAAKWNSR